MTDEDLIDWNQRVGLSHATQIQTYRWCICEDTDSEGHLSDDCQKGD